MSTSHSTRPQLDAIRPILLKERQDRKPSHTSHVYSSTGELVQQMFDYARYTGDEKFLKEVCGPWLYEAARSSLYLLTRGDDGRYHVECAHANETYWKIRDSLPQLCSVKYLLGMVVKHGKALGFDEKFIAVAKEHLENTAPYPMAESWKAKAWQEVFEVTPGDKMYLPGDITGGQKIANGEDCEMYMCFPFAMDRFDEGGIYRDRILKTNAARLNGSGGGGGWCPAPVQEARLRTNEAWKKIHNHAMASTPWKYGGGTSPGGGFYKGSRGTSTVMFDGSGVYHTGVQEALLQSHTPEPADSLLDGGVVRILPVPNPDISGSLKLRARGGFIVEATFEKGSVIKALITSERGGELKLENPRETSSVTVGGKPAGVFKDRIITVKTSPGDKIAISN